MIFIVTRQGGQMLRKEAASYHFKAGVVRLYDGTGRLLFASRCLSCEAEELRETFRQLQERQAAE